MASRGPFGFRIRQTDKEDKKASASTNLTRKPSLTVQSSGSNASRLPKHTPSLFSKAKPGKSQNEPTSAPLDQLAANIPIGRGQTPVSMTSASSLPSLQQRNDTAKSAGLGISMENKTTQVSKSGKPRNVLRRRAPTIESRGGYERTESSASSYDPPPSRQGLAAKNSPEVRSDPFSNQVLGVTAPTISSIPAASKLPGLGPSFEFDTSSSRMARYNSRKTPSPAPPLNAATSTPSNAADSGSSTRVTDSPSSHSHSSTPTSMTSYSPGISTPVSMPSVRGNVKPPGQSRPPISMANKWRQGFDHSSQTLTGLTSVRESGTSSSSSSTVKASGSREESSKVLSGTGRSSPLVPTIPSVTSPVTASFRSTVRPGKQPERGQREDRAKQPAGRTPLSSPDAADVLSSPTKHARGDVPPTRPSRDGVPSLDMKKLHLDFTVPRSGPPSLVRSPSNASSMSAQNPRLAASPIISSAGVNKQAKDGLRSPESTIVESKVSAGRTRRDPSPQSASSSRSTSRFALFSRRTKSPMESTANEATDKASRKGPAAGTGHEGYGKYARRGRSGSLSTSASRGRSTSSTSVGRTPSSRKSSITSRDDEQMDPFYRSRLEPKKIIGGGQSVTSSMHTSAVSLPETGPSSLAFAPTVETLDNTVSSHSVSQIRSVLPQTEPERVHALRHVDRRLPRRDGLLWAVEPGQESDPKMAAEESTPTLATRRSIHRSQFLLGAEPLRIPAPIDTRATAPSPALDSQNTYGSSVPQSDSTIPLSDDISEGREGNWLKPSKKEKVSRSPMKWAFFSRGPSSPRKGNPPTSSQPDMEKPSSQLRAQMPRYTERQNMAYYEMISSGEQGEVEGQPSYQMNDGAQRSSQEGAQRRDPPNKLLSSTLR